MSTPSCARNCASLPSRSRGTVFDLPGVEAMLEEAIAVKLPDRRRRHRREAVHSGTIEKGSR